jgi:uncharacterized protein YbjT (DUF2867 family)
MSRSVLLCGATGLVGGECLRLLLRDPSFSRIVTVTRRPLGPVGADAGDPVKIEERVVDFERLDRDLKGVEVDEVICALGTTRRAAGSRSRFREVDLGYPLQIARIASAGGSRHFLLVSAVGADPRSRFLYNRVKGELESAVSSLPFRSVTIVRPSLLLGEREVPRLGERIAARLAFLAPASLRPVKAADVAAALLHEASQDRVGQRVIASPQIPVLADLYRASAKS